MKQIDLEPHKYRGDRRKEPMMTPENFSNFIYVLGYIAFIAGIAWVMQWPALWLATFVAKLTGVEWDGPG